MKKTILALGLILLTVGGSYDPEPVKDVTSKSVINRELPPVH